jgi:hypothetical protein
MKKDNIEDLYGELESFSKAPPEELWDNIEARLHPKKKKRRVLFFWGSAAAVLVMFLGYVFSNSLVLNDKPINEISDIEQPKGVDSTNKSNVENIIIVEGLGEDDTNQDSLVEESSILKGPLNIIKSQQQLTESHQILNKVEEERKKSLYEKNRSIKEEGIKHNNSYSQNDSKEKDDRVNNKVIPDLNKKNKTITNFKKEKRTASVDSISKVKDVAQLDLPKALLAENENAADSTATDKVASLKWSVEVLGGLTNTNPSQSSIQETSVNTTPQNDFVYALKVGYALSDRLTVKSGVGKNILGQEISNIRYTSSDVTLASNNPQSITSNEAIMFFGSQEAVNDFSTTEVTINEGTLGQKLDYIQVPLEFSYSLFKAQKYSVSLGLGGNVNFLSDNSVFLDGAYIGENLGVSSTVFGATLNSNISFEVTKKMILFLEPSYNYFNKPIESNNQRFNNTQIKALFGLQYKF